MSAIAVPAAGAAGPTNGEVYRVWLDGRRIDLTRSPADDSVPVVSPDGKQVAFVRSGPVLAGRGVAYLYVVGSDGRGIERLSTALPADQSFEGQLAWSPDSKRVAVAAAGATVSGAFDTTLLLLGPGHSRHVLARAPIVLEPAWSPDGRVLAFRTGVQRHNAVWAVDARGRTLWRVHGSRFAWAGRRVAIQVHGRRGSPETVRVYDERGRPVSTFPARSFAWSPRGDRLASVVANRVEIHRATGRRLFSRVVAGLRAAGGNGVAWAGLERVVIGGIGVDGARVVDLRSGRSSAGGGRYFGNLSPDRRLVADLVNAGHGYALRVSRLDGRGARVLARRTHCPDLVEADVQWLPDGRSLVYDLKCEG